MQQRLVLRFATPQALEANRALGEIDLGAHEAMGPQRIDQVTPSQQFGLALLVGAAQEDHHPLQRPLQIEFPVRGEGRPRRGAVAPRRQALAHRSDEAVGMARQRLEMVVLETLPNLGLPAAVVVLDGRLETSLSGRREDRDDAPLQAQAEDAAERVGPLMGPLEDGVVVELGIAGQALLPPVGDQRGDRGFRCPRRADPTAAEAPVKAHGVEHHDVGATADNQALHEVEAVQFGLGARHGRQIPALGRRGPPDTSPAIEHATALENAPDGANRRQGLDPTFLQFAPAGGRPVFASGAGRLELLAETDDQVFDPGGGCRRGPPPATGSIGAIDAVQAWVVGPVDPDLDGAQADAEPSGHGAQRPALSHGGHQGPALLFLAVFRS